MVQGADGLTDYERERLERIRLNQERMKQLDLQNLAAELAPPSKPVVAPAKPRGLSTKRKRLTEVLPPRRSSRLQGEEADGAEIQTELRNGTVVVLGPAGGKYNAEPAEAPPSRDRHPKGDIPFTSNNSTPVNDEAFLKTLRAAGGGPSSFSGSAKTAAAASIVVAPLRRSRGRAAETPEATKHIDSSTGRKAPALKSSSILGAGVKELAKFSLAETDVSKITKDAVTHLAFMPVTSNLILAAADKKGNIGLWQVDYKPSEEVSKTPTNANDNIEIVKDNSSGSDDQPSDAAMELADDDMEDSEYDGVLSFSIHYEYISGLKWAGGGSAPSLMTCAYDGSIRKLNPERGVFELAWGDEEMEYSCFDVSADGNLAYIGDKDGDLDIIDLRSKQRVHTTMTLHDRKVNTVHVDPVGGHVMATGATDKRIRLWDVRKLGPKPDFLAENSHNQACQAAYLAPDGSQRVVSTSFDDTVRVWDGKKDLAPLVKIKHDCQTGRWILPLRAVWSAKGDAVIVGGMKRTVHVYDAANGKLGSQLSSEYMTAIPARNCVHPELPLLAGGTGSGRIHIYR